MRPVGYHGNSVRLERWKVKEALLLFLVEGRVDFRERGQQVHGEKITVDGGKRIVETNEELKNLFGVTDLLGFFDSIAGSRKNRL